MKMKAPNPEWDIIIDMMLRQRITTRAELASESGIPNQSLRRREYDPGLWRLCEIRSILVDTLACTDEDIVRFVRGNKDWELQKD